MSALGTDAQIPVSRRAPCEFCGVIIDVSAVGTFQHVSGWARNRKAGGTNTVQLAKRDYRWACPSCVGCLTDGRPIGQTSLF